MLQRWRGQAREYRQKQLLSLEKPKHNARLHVPAIARGVATEDAGNNSKVHLSCVLSYLMLLHLDILLRVSFSYGQVYCCSDVSSAN